MRKSLDEILEKVPKVPGEEIVKFLPDVFDALFNILVDPLETVLTQISGEKIEDCFGAINMESSDRNVFECLVSITFEVFRFP